MCTRLNSPGSLNGNIIRSPAPTLPISTPEAPTGTGNALGTRPRRMRRNAGVGPHRLAATAAACSPGSVRRSTLGGAVGGCVVRTVTVAVAVPSANSVQFWMTPSTRNDQA